VKRKLLRHPEARRDLVEIADYIARDSIDAALRFLDAADATFRELLEFPGMGPVRDIGNERLGELHSWAVRDFDNYLIIYRVTPEALEVLRVLHGARDIDGIFGG
jgi:toxin ParE1/3/4